MVDASAGPTQGLTALADLPLVGAGGEPVSLARTLASHGVASLPPNAIDEAAWTLTTTLAAGPRVHTVRLEGVGAGLARLWAVGPPPHAPAAAALVRQVRHMLRLDDDLSRFYARIMDDRLLSWAAIGAGRMMRSPSVFEDVVKTICTTNCAWSATVRMVGALVQGLGRDSGHGRAFPDAQAMAEAPAGFYKDVARTGYRGAYLQALGREVTEGRLDLEALQDPGLKDAEVERRLLALPGVGPYAAAHVMLTALGRSRSMILDSWTRPTYARLSGRAADDAAIRRRFRRYGDKAGLAFWLYLTRDWVADAAAPARPARPLPQAEAAGPDRGAGVVRALDRGAGEAPA